MVVPGNLLYAKTHEWVRFIDGKARVGLTDFAQDSLGDIVFFTLPTVGSEASVGDAIGEVESVKAVSEIFAAVGGIISAVNDTLVETPESVNVDPYGIWIFEIDNATGKEGLMSPGEYEAFCNEEARP